MNAPTRIAQISGADGSKPTRFLKIEKPQGGQAVTAEASYDGTVKIDFSAIANEKITLVHIGERLIILFDNQSTVTIIPFFDSMGVPLTNITIESNGKEFTGGEFASTFPITTDQSVLPAAGDGVGTPASGASFSNPSVDPLLAPDPLPLLGPEELPPINFTRIEGPVDNFDAVPGAGLNDPVSIDEDDIDSPFSLGNGDNAPGDDDPISVSGVLKFTVGTAPTTVGFASMDGDTVEGEDGKGISGPLTSQGHDLVYVWDAGTNTLKAVWSDDPDHVVFQIEVNPATGAYTLSLFDQLDHPYTDDPSTSADDATVTGFEDNLIVDLVYTVTDGNGDVATGTLAVDFDDDMPRVTGAVESRIVDEDDIKTPWSHGTSPNDGPGDGSITEDWSGAAFVSGTLAGLVDIGADEYPEESEGEEPEGEDQPAIVGSGIIFSFTPDVVDQMEALGLYSKQSVQPATENGLPLFYTTGTSGDWQILSAFEPDTAGPGNTGNPVFELRINQITGEYEFRLFDELIHQLPPGFPNGSDENFGLRSGEPDPVTGQAIVNGLDFGSIIRVTDYDGDSVTLDGKFLIQIRDDVPDPDIDLNCGESVIHDETPGDDGADDQSFNSLPSSARTAFTGVTATANDPDVPSTNLGAIGFAHDDDPIVFIDFGGTELGADHPPASQVFSLAIVGGNGVDSGLDITEGNSILLYKEGDVIVGRVSGGPFDGQAAFAIHINQNGEISVAQWLSIKHDDRGDFDESNDDGFGDDASPNDTPDPIQQTLSGKLNAVLTITDSDGDSESDSVGIGDRIIFQDDGPEFKKLEAKHELTHDETPGNQGDANDIDVSGVPAAALAAFNAISNKGDDPHVPPTPGPGPIGYAVTNGSILNVQVDYGSDGQGAPIAYELVLDGNNLHSGLETTDGRDIHLFKEGNIIVGRYEVGGNNQPDGAGNEPAAFAIYIDPATGQTTMVQYVSLRHPDTGSHDEEVDIDNGLLYVKVTVVDGDGDPLTDYVDIGSKIEFQDDGPTATFTLNSGISVIHDETVGVDSFDSNDVAPGSLANLFSSIGTKGNDPHDTTAPEPEIGYAQSTGPIVTVSNVSFGADGPGSGGGIQYRIDVPGVSDDDESIPSGLFTTDGRAIYLFEEDGLVVGRYEDDNFNANAPENNDPAAFAIHVDPTTGVVTVVQYVSIKHDDVNDHDEANDDGSSGNDEPALNDAAVQQWINNSALRLTVTVTDGDGDGTSQQFNIGNKIIFQDDGPTGQNSIGVYKVSGVVVGDTLDDENQFPAFPPGSDGISGGYGDDGVGTTAVGSVNINYGVDGPATATNSLVVTGPAGVSVVVVDSEGNATTETISYVWQPAGGGGGTLLGVSASFPAGDPAFSLTISATGNYTFNAYAPLSHPLTDDPTTIGTVETEFEDNLSLVFNYQATDGDGDFATGTITIKVDDDTPDPVCDQFEVTEGGDGSVNIVLILDRSGSMATDDVDGFDSRLALAKFAAINLLNSANVNQVMTVQFDSGSAINNNGGVWTDKASAINYINGLTTGSGTNYDSPLNLVQSNWGSGPTPATKTLVFFISDGEPNQPGGSAGISSGEETTWYDFLASKGVNDAYAIGIGTGVNGADENQLEPVAWHPGEASATNPTAATDNNVVVVSNSDLTDLIGALVGLLPGVVSGNVLANDGFGADGLGGITSITIDGVVYSYNELTDQIISINGTVNGSTLDVDTDIGGHLTFHFADGGGFDAGDFSYQSPANGVPPEGVDEIFTYTIVDGDGDGQSAHLKIHVLDGNEELTISGAVTGLVEEEHGILGGIDDLTSAAPDVDQDVDGNLNNTRNVQTGTFAASLVFDGDEGALSFSIADVATGTQVLKVGGGDLTSNEQNVLFHRVDANTLVGYVEQAGAGYNAGQDRTVFTLTLNQPSAGDYTFTLHDNLDHHPDLTPDDVEGIIGIDLNNRVLITDTGESGDDELIANFTVNVIDDVPVAQADNHEVEVGAQGKIDLLLVVDVSQSMQTEVPGTGGQTRIDLARDALLQLVNNPSVDEVKIVRFRGASISTVWMDKAAAIAFINNPANFDESVIGAGGTNYDAALFTGSGSADNAFDTPPATLSDRYVFFLSDGEPTAGGGISSTEEANWIGFLSGNDVVKSVAIGFGDLNATNENNLEPIAWQSPEVAGTHATAAADDNVIVIADDDLTELGDILEGELNTADGNVLANDPGFGADGGYIKSIIVDGVTYTFNGVGTITESGSTPAGYEDHGTWILVPTELGGELIFYFANTGPNLAGHWQYTPPASLPANDSESFEYTLVDGDGDTTSADLNIDVVLPPNDPPNAGDNAIDGLVEAAHTNNSSGVGGLSAGTASGAVNVLTNDADPGDTLRVSEITPQGGSATVVPNGGSVVVQGVYGTLNIHSNGTTTYNLDNSLVATQALQTGQNVQDIFNYKVTDSGSLTDTAQITVNIAGANDAPVIWAPATFDFVPGGTNDDNFHLNTIKFSDVDSPGSVTVTLTNGNGDNGTFIATTGGGVTVAGSATDNMTLTGTIAAINAFIAGNNLRYDMNGTSGENVIVTINDGNGGTDTHTIAVNDNSVGSGGEDLPDENTFNLYPTLVDLGGDGDSLTTGWNHLGSAATEYEGGSGSDTIRVVFTPDQLSEVLNNVSQQNALRTFLTTPSSDLNLDASSWNAIVDNFETANLGLAAPRETSGQDNYVNLDTWDPLPVAVAVGAGNGNANLIVGTAVGQTLDGLGGNDVLAAFHTGANTLNGGSGSDLLLGGDGNDILNGGDGADILAGGKGADTFKATSAPGDANEDILVDYGFAEGDTLDLSSLLDSAFDVGDNINSFIQVETVNTSDLVLRVDQTGTGNFGGKDVFLLIGAATNSGDPLRVFFDGTNHVVTG